MLDQLECLLAVAHVRVREQQGAEESGARAADLEARRPASLEICSLFWKKGEQAVPLDVKYPGFEIPPVFVVGYGLDYSEKYRNLPYIGVLKESAYTA